MTPARKLALLLLAARAFVVASLLLLVIATYGAVTVQHVPAAQAWPLSTTTVASRPPVDEALANDPFHPARPAFNSDVAVPRAPARASAPSAPPDVRVLGTVVLAGGRSFAICQLPNEVPRTVREGASVGDLVLIAVEPGRVTFRRPGGERVVVTVAKPET